MRRHYSNDDLLADIRGRVDRASLRKVALELGFSAQFLHEVLAGNRVITARLGDSLGYVKLPRPKAIRPPQMWEKKGK